MGGAWWGTESSNRSSAPARLPPVLESLSAVCNTGVTHDEPYTYMYGYTHVHCMACTAHPGSLLLLAGHCLGPATTSEYNSKPPVNRNSMLSNQASPNTAKGLVKPCHI